MSGDNLVDPLYEREADGAPGPFYVVKDQCILCALPPATAPANISWSEQTLLRGGLSCPRHCRVSRQPETEAELSAVIEAAHRSCVDAIRYCGTAPCILARFKALGDERLCDARLSGASSDPAF